MAKKSTDASSTGEGVKKIEKFKGRVEDLKGRGFTCIGHSMPQVMEFTIESMNDKRQAMAGEGSKFPGGKIAHKTFGMFDAKQSNPTPVEHAGTPGLGYIPWGPNNDLPNQIYNLAANLPYSAAAPVTSLSRYVCCSLPGPRF